MWIVMSSTGSTAVNSLELTNFSSSKIQIARLLTDKTVLNEQSLLSVVPMKLV